MTRQDLGRSELELFLSDAADAMRRYHHQHGVYPDRWHRLSMTFAASLYHFGDPDVRPTVEAKHRWRPRGCDLIYVITAATADGYRIEAVDEAGMTMGAIGPAGPVEWPDANDSRRPPAAVRGDRESTDPEEIALRMVWEAAHGVYLGEHPEADGDSIEEELYANINQLNFYEEVRDRGNLDRELERRRAARLAGTLLDDVKGRYPHLPDHT